MSMPDPYMTWTHRLLLYGHTVTEAGLDESTTVLMPCCFYLETLNFFLSRQDFSV